MRYHRAQDIFPAELLLEIQKYVDGEYIYIPKLETNKKAWGENTLSKQETCKMCIRDSYLVACPFIRENIFYEVK